MTDLMGQVKGDIIRAVLSEDAKTLNQAAKILCEYVSVLPIDDNIKSQLLEGARINNALATTLTEYASNA